MHLDKAYDVPDGRWFVAIGLPEAIRRDLGGLKSRACGIRNTPEDQLHLTLRFIGPAAPETIASLVRHLAAVRVEPFILTPQGVGRFPPRGRARVLWAGFGAVPPRLLQLRRQIEEAVLAAGLPVEERTFVPHVTLARCGSASPGAIAEFLKIWRDFSGGPFRVEAFSLKVSQLAPGGASHREVERFRLGDGTGTHHPPE